MLRAAAALLLLANLFFFGWRQGWFGAALPPPRHGEHEPARLATQVRPETVTLLAAPAASAAINAARAATAVCLEAGPLADADLPAADSALAAAQLPPGSVARVPVPPPPLWLVATARLPDAAQRRARDEELRRANLAPTLLQVPDAPPDVAPALLLSRHVSRGEADEALAALLAASAPPRGLRVVGLPAPPQQQWLRAARADADQQVRLLALPPDAVAGGFKPCAPRS